jgi:hypothetical protein
VHFYQDGAICRPVGAVDDYMDKVDATLARYGLAGSDKRPVFFP